jgi:transposase InsO family protein
VRREFLDAEVFVDLADAREGGYRFKQFYNQIRPHGALNYKTPAAFAATLVVVADGTGRFLKEVALAAY